MKEVKLDISYEDSIDQIIIKLVEALKEIGVDCHVRKIEFPKEKCQ